MERYKLLKVVGDGTFGVVYKACNTATGEICAIKKMKRKFLSWEECLNLREIMSLRKFNNPSIIKLKEVFRINEELNMVFEFMDENVYELIRDRVTPLPENRVRSIIGQVLQGLAYIHRHGFFHRDLKPENLMMLGEVCKIADFGLAKEIRSRPPFTDYVSTRWYRAPEILLRSRAYSSPVDLFAVGCIMAELYMLRPLAAGTNELDQLSKLVSVLGTPSVSSWPEGYKLAAEMNFRFTSSPGTSFRSLFPTASVEGIELLTALLQWDPQKRPTAAESLKFAFFQQSAEGKPVGDASEAKNESRWSHGSSRITGNSSKGKWSFRAAVADSKEFTLPQLRAGEEGRKIRKNAPGLGSPGRENKFPLVKYRKAPSRKASRERPVEVGGRDSRGKSRNKGMEQAISPRGNVRLPPLSHAGSNGKLALKKIK
jgi:serine/threonine protein kinase